MSGVGLVAPFLAGVFMGAALDRCHGGHPRTHHAQPGEPSVSDLR